MMTQFSWACLLQRKKAISMGLLFCFSKEILVLVEIKFLRNFYYVIFVENNFFYFFVFYFHQIMAY